MAKVLIANLPQKTTPANTDILIIEDTTTKKITVADLLAGASGGLTDAQINGTSVVSNNVANFVTNTAYNATSNKIATMTDITNAITAAIEASY